MTEKMLTGMLNYNTIKQTQLINKLHVIVTSCASVPKKAPIKDTCYCLISLTLPVALCLYMGFLIAWRIVYSRALHGKL